MPIPILPALIAGAAYLIYSGFREEGPVATPKRGPGRPKGAKAKASTTVATKAPKGDLSRRRSRSLSRRRSRSRSRSLSRSLSRTPA